VDCDSQDIPERIPLRNTPMKIMNFIYRFGSRSVSPSAYGDDPVNNSRLRLYVDSQYTSPYAMSAFVVLREKGIEFEMSQLDLEAFENQTQDYASLSLSQRVPTLVHGDFALSESSAITEYLEDVFPLAPVYPQDLMQRAKARQVQAWLRSDLLPIRQERTTLVVFYSLKSAPLSPAAESAARKLIGAAQTLLADSPEYLFGQWSIADVDLALMLNRLILNGDFVPPALVEYAQRQWQRPAVQEWVKLQRPAM
jgi:glutathione S-transferase